MMMVFVVVIVGMFLSMLSAVVAFHPDAGAVGVVFFFPDRDGVFNGVDDGAAGVECGIAVGGADSDGDGNFSDLKVSGAVEAAGGDDVVFDADVGEDPVTFFFGKGGECFVFERSHIAALVVVADPAFEGGESTGFGRADFSDE